MAIWKEPKSNYVATDEVVPDIFNELAENEKYLKETQDTKITTDQVKDATISNTIYATRTNLTASEKLSTGFAKIRKWFSDLGALAFKSTVGNADITDVAAGKVTGLHAVATSGNYSDLGGKPTLGSLAAKNSVADADITGVSAGKIAGKVASAAAADTAAGADKLKQTDTRDINNNPQYYMSLGMGQILEFKNNGVIGITGAGTYSQVWTIIPWGDGSGGYPVQVAHNSGGMFLRRGINNTSWNAWSRLLTAVELAAANGIATLNSSGELVQNAQSATKATNDDGGNKISTTYIKISTKNAANGVAGLNASSKITASQLPIGTSSTAGAVKGGGNVTIAADGTLSASGQTGSVITVTARSGLGNLTNLDSVLNYISNVFNGTQKVTKLRATTFDAD